MFIKPILIRNYETDDSEYLSGLLNYIKSKDDNILHFSVSNIASSTITDEIPSFDNKSIKQNIIT